MINIYTAFGILGIVFLFGGSSLVYFEIITQIEGIVSILIGFVLLFLRNRMAYDRLKRSDLVIFLLTIALILLFATGPVGEILGFDLDPVISANREKA